MKLRARFLSLTLGAGSLLLGGCTMTTFEQAPLAAEACDPALAGLWTSVSDDPSENGEVELKIGADCRLSVDEHTSSGLRTGESTPLYLGRHAGQSYVWFDATWAVKRFDEDHQPAPGDVSLLRYALDGDRLQLWGTEEKAIAHAIIDGELKGEVRAADSRLFNRLVGQQKPSVLERPGFFDAEPVRFERAGKAMP